MAGMRIDSIIEGVPSTDLNSPVSYGQLQSILASLPSSGSGGSGKISGRQLFSPRYGDYIHPAANANGPIVTNNPITTTKPDTTGMIFIPWNKIGDNGRAAFNRQGQNWEAALSPFQPSQSACVNVTTNRSGGYTSSTQTVGGMELHFVTQSKRIIPQFQINGPYNNNGWWDAHFMVEDQGRMARLQNLPEQIVASTSTVPYYKEYITQGSRQTREHRGLLPGHTVLHGVWIEQGCDLYAGPNYPLIPFDGDSWLEAFSAGTWVSGAGLGDVYGGYMAATIGWWLVMMTGVKGVWNGQGGSGVTNPGSGNGTTVFLSPGRNTYFANKFAAQKPVAYCLFGGGNDGYHNGPVGTAQGPYRDLVLAGMADLRTKCNDPTLPFIFNGPQSLSDPLVQFPAGPQSVHRASFMEIANNSLNNAQFFDQIDYTYGDFGGSQGNPATSSWAQFAADVLHGNISGQKYIAHRYMDDLSKLMFSMERLAACLAWSA